VLSEVVAGIRVLALRTPTLPPATHTNCVVLGLEEIVLWDPATPWDDERARLGAEVDALQAAGAVVREIWLSHHHGDHVGAAMWLAQRLGVPLAAHERTAALIGFPVDRQVRDGEVLVLGALRFHAIHTPGHASGHLCLWEPASRTLVAGDMLAGVGTIIIDPPDGDMALYLGSLARLRALDPAVAVPAHGEPIHSAVAKIDEYVRHRLWREVRILDALRAHTGPAFAADLVPAVYTDVPAALFPLAERSLLAHLEKLVKDAKAARYVDRFEALS